MTDVEKRIDDLESRAAGFLQLAELSNSPATRIHNIMLAEDHMALAKTLRAPGVAARWRLTVLGH